MFNYELLFHDEGASRHPALIHALSRLLKSQVCMYVQAFCLVAFRCTSSLLTHALSFFFNVLQTVNPADIAAVHAAYSDASLRPPVDLLRVPALIGAKVGVYRLLIETLRHSFVLNFQVSLLTAGMISSTFSHFCFLSPRFDD